MTFRSLFPVAVIVDVILSVSIAIAWGCRVAEIVSPKIQNLFFGFLFLFIFVSSAAVNAALVSEQEIYFDIPRQQADGALTALGQQADITVLYRYDIVNAHRTNQLKGEYTLDKAVLFLLEGTSLKAEFAPAGHLIITDNNDQSRVNSMKETLNKKKLSIGLFAAIASIFGGSVDAQVSGANSATGIEEIVVSGIRAGLERSALIKRESSQIVDAVSAEEAGKFPDGNVAEALQRITGVAIDRSGGEGQFITVRGLGPEFNTVLVNGRTMATDNAGREFSFDILASDIIQRAEVYKSPIPQLQEGGIGATVNIITARPLSYSGSGLSISASTISDTLSDKTTPNGTALFSFANEDNTHGFLGSVSYAKRESQVDSAFLEGWISGSQTVIDGNANSVGLDASSVVTSDDIHIPRNYNFGRASEERERLVVNGTYEGLLSDTVKLTVDGLYSDLDVVNDQTFFGAFFTAPYIGVETNSEGTVTGFNRPGSDFVAANPDVNAALSQNDNVRSIMDRQAESYQVGINLQWDVSNTLNLEGDLSASNATSTVRNPFVVIGSLATTAPRFDLTGEDLPQLSNLGDITDPSLQRHHFSRDRLTEVEDDIVEARFQASWEFDNDSFKGLSTGILYSDRQKTGSRATSPERCAYCGYNLPVDPSLLTTVSFDGYLNDASGSENVPAEFFTFDPYEVLAALADPANIANPLRQPGLTPEEFEADVAEILAQAGNGFAVADEPGRSRNVTGCLFEYQLGR